MTIVMNIFEVEEFEEEDEDFNSDMEDEQE